MVCFFEKKFDLKLNFFPDNMMNDEAIYAWIDGHFQSNQVWLPLDWEKLVSFDNKYFFYY